MNKLTLILLLLPSFIFAQYYGTIPLKLKKEGKPYRIDSLCYYLESTDDNRKDQSRYGTGYYGILNHHVIYGLKKSLPKSFEKFFSKGLKNTNLGEKKIIVSINELSVNEPASDFKGALRMRNYVIDLDYYLLTERGKLFIMSDRKELDTATYKKQYIISHFTTDFFESSLIKLNKQLKTEIVPKYNSDTSNSLTIYESQIVVNQKADTLSFRLKQNRTFNFYNANINEADKEHIEKAFNNADRGRYTISYRGAISSASKDSDFTILDYKTTISPHWFIVIPVLVITGFLSGYYGS